jgi:hypothetical protein
MADWNTFAAATPDSTACFKLIVNLDFTGINTAPIAPGIHPFCGTLDGNGHTLSNMTIFNVAHIDIHNQVALFADLGSGAMVKNLWMDNTTITGDSYYGTVSAYTASVAGQCTYGATIQDCTVTNAYITATYNTSSYSQCGVIVAYLTVTRSLRFALKMKVAMETGDVTVLSPGGDTAEDEFDAQEVRR